MSKNRQVVILGSDLNEAMFEQARKKLQRYGIDVIRVENERPNDGIVARVRDLSGLSRVYNMFGGVR